MKAFVLHKIGDASLAEIPVPESGKDEKLVRVTACGLCRTDAKMLTSGQRDMVLPRILGHEICGVETRSGRRVVVWPGLACGKCDFCGTHRENLCPSLKIIGFSRDGGLAEYAAAPSSSLINVPDTLSSVTATLAEPLGAAINALEKLKLQQGQKLLILGGGPLGLLLAFAAGKVYRAVPTVLELSSSRRKLGRNFLKTSGAEILPVPPSGTVFDAAVNATSNPESLLCGLRKLRSGGKFCLFSGFLKDSEAFTAAVMNEIHYRELGLCGAYGCTRPQMRKALELLASHADHVGQLISEVLPLEKTDCGLRKILEGKGLKWVVSAK
ncbi:MAG: alcohol dehydrogenase catalytic domain-containing protein [Victivallales bacterium]|jgi:threonine dehydrogenase-like Zn-dependent dehydrogenase